MNRQLSEGGATILSYQYMLPPSVNHRTYRESGGASFWGQLLGISHQATRQQQEDSSHCLLLIWIIYLHLIIDSRQVSQLSPVLALGSLKYNIQLRLPCLVLKNGTRFFGRQRRGLHRITFNRMEPVHKRITHLWVKAASFYHVPFSFYGKNRGH